MKPFFIAILSLLPAFSETVFAQDIIAKLKPEYKEYLADSGIVNKRLKSLLGAMGTKKVQKVLNKKYLKPTSLDNTIAIHLNNSDYKGSVAKSLQQSKYFEYVEARATKANTALHIPNDPFAQPSTGTQYYLEKINAYKAWDISKGDTNVVVCIVDNGIEWTHPEMQSKIKYNQNDPIDSVDNDKDGYVDNYMGWDIANNDPYPEDSTGAVAHGTEVSALAVGLTNNNLGIASVGYNCKFIPVKIFKDGNPAGNEAYDGVIYAAQHGCKVINLSWGQVGGFSQYEQSVINFAVIDNDAVVVAATFPQEGDMVFTTPGDYDNVLSVLALQSNDQKAIPQAYHYWIDISAPSIDVFTANIHGEYRYNSGVSLGVPLVTGAAALARSVHPKMNSTQIQELLRVTATDIDTVATNKNYKEKLGHGRLDAYKALTDTVTPAIRILQYELTKMQGDTVSLQLGFKNYLWPSQNLIFDFRQLSGGFQVIDSSTSVGVVNMGDSSSTALSGITLRILPFTSSNSTEIVRIGISDTANHYFDYQYFYLDKNSVATPVVTQVEVSQVIGQDLKVYPNPCTENVYIEMNNAEELTISDLAGKTIAIYTSPGDIVSVSMKERQSGIYFARIRTKSGSFSSKFLKK